MAAASVGWCRQGLHTYRIGRKPRITAGQITGASTMGPGGVGGWLIRPLGHSPTRRITTTTTSGPRSQPPPRGGQVIRMEMMMKKFSFTATCCPPY